MPEPTNTILDLISAIDQLRKAVDRNRVCVNRRGHTVDRRIQYGSWETANLKDLDRTVCTLARQKGLSLDHFPLPPTQSPAEPQLFFFTKIPVVDTGGGEYKIEQGFAAWDHAMVDLHIMAAVALPESTTPAHEKPAVSGNESTGASTPEPGKP